MPKLMLNSAKIKAYMLLNNLSQNELARKMGVDGPTLNRAINGKRGASLSIHRGLMAIGLDPRDFVLTK